MEYGTNRIGSCPERCSNNLVFAFRPHTVWSDVVKFLFVKTGRQAVLAAFESIVIYCFHFNTPQNKYDLAAAVAPFNRLFYFYLQIILSSLEAKAEVATLNSLRYPLQSCSHWFLLFILPCSVLFCSVVSCNYS